jgi:hypothetical protein
MQQQTSFHQSQITVGFREIGEIDPGLPEKWQCLNCIIIVKPENWTVSSLGKEVQPFCKAQCYL